MITPKQFKQQQELAKSEDYIRAIELAEKLSEWMEKWAADKRCSGWFTKNNEGITISSQEGVHQGEEIVRELVNNKGLADLVFKEFAKNGWLMEFSKPYPLTQPDIVNGIHIKVKPWWKLI